MVDLIRLFGSATVTGSSGPARLPAGVGEIVALLAIDYRQVAERRTLALHGLTERDSWFGAILSVKEYPPAAGPGMLDALHDIFIVKM